MLVVFDSENTTKAKKANMVARTNFISKIHLTFCIIGKGYHIIQVLAFFYFALDGFFLFGPIRASFWYLFTPAFFASMIYNAIRLSIEHFRILTRLASIPGLSQHTGGSPG